MYLFLAYAIEVDDECVAAADIYKCGTDKVPEIVHDMVQVAKGSPNIVYFPLTNVKSKFFKI
jgi:hypothetical protein